MYLLECFRLENLFYLCWMKNKVKGFLDDVDKGVIELVASETRDIDSVVALAADERGPSETRDTYTASQL